MKESQKVIYCYYIFLEIITKELKSVISSNLRYVKT